MLHNVLRRALVLSLTALAVMAGPAFANVDEQGPWDGDGDAFVIPEPDVKPYGAPGPVTVGDETFDVSPMLASELKDVLADDEVAQSSSQRRGCTWRQAIAWAIAHDDYNTRYWWPAMFWYWVGVQYSMC